MSAACTKCGAGLPAALLACASCGQLVHARELKRLAAQAEAAHGAGDGPAALAAWRTALPLLPKTSRQHQVVRAQVEALSRTLADPAANANSAAPLAPSWAKRLGPFGGIARLGSHPATAVETASGGGASAWAALAHAGAWLKLFNLLPVWQLDFLVAIPVAGRR